MIDQTYRLAWLLAALLSFPVGAQEVSLGTPDWAAARVDYEAALDRDRDDVQRFRSASANDIDQVKLPVVLPVFGAQRSTGGFFHQQTAYGAVYPFNGAQLTVTGTTGAILIGDDVGQSFPDLLDPAPGYQFETSEAGADLSFQRYGSSYVLRVSCGGQNDSRCTEPTFLIGIADTMEPLGGEGLVAP